MPLVPQSNAGRGCPSPPLGTPSTCRGMALSTPREQEVGADDLQEVSVPPPVPPLRQRDECVPCAGQTIHHLRAQSPRVPLKTVPPVGAPSCAASPHGAGHHPPIVPYPFHPAAVSCCKINGCLLGFFPQKIVLLSPGRECDLKASPKIGATQEGVLVSGTS